MGRGRAFTGLLVFGLFAACDDTGGGLLGGDETTRTEAHQAADSTDLTSIEAALLAAAAAETTLGGTPTEMATEVAAAAETTFTPADCVTTQVVEATVTYTFDNCAGPRGLVGLSGAATLVYSVEAETSVSMSLTATNLSVNDATMTISANGTYSQEGGENRLDLTTAGAGTTSDGTLVGRTGTYLATFDASCITVNGQWTTSIADVFWSTGVEDYHVCGSACPDSGRIGYVGVAAPDDAADPLDGSGIIITFDGDNTARYVSPRGAIGEINLSCGG